MCGVFCFAIELSRLLFFRPACTLLPTRRILLAVSCATLRAGSGVPCTSSMRAAASRSGFRATTFRHETIPFSNRLLVACRGNTVAQPAWDAELVQVPDRRHSRTTTRHGGDVAFQAEPGFRSSLRAKKKATLLSQRGLEIITSRSRSTKTGCKPRDGIAPQEL